MPWPRLKMCGPPRSASARFHLRFHLLVRPRPAASGSRLPCTDLPGLAQARHVAEGMAVSQPIASHPVSAHIAYEHAARPARKPMIGTPGCRRRNARDDAPGRLEHPGARTRSAAGLPAQLSKICKTSAPATHLLATDNRSTLETSISISCREALRIAIGPKPRRRPDPACLRRRPCRSRPSKARRKSR